MINLNKWMINNMGKINYNDFFLLNKLNIKEKMQEII